MALAILQIRVRSGVLYLGRPGELHDLMDIAHDEAGLYHSVAGIAADRAALAQLRRGWPTLAPGANTAQMQHVELVKDVARSIKARRIDAALIADQGMFIPEQIKFSSSNAAHIGNRNGTLVIAARSAFDAGDLARSDPGEVVEFFKSPLADEDIAGLCKAWPDLIPGGGQAPGGTVAMAQQLADAVRKKQVGAVVYVGMAGKRQAADRKDAPKPVSAWSLSDKLRATLLRSLDYLTASLRGQIAEFFTAKNIASFVAVLAIFAVLQAIPVVGEIVDAGLLAMLWWYGGKQALTGLMELAKGAIAANAAKNSHDIDEAAKILAKGLEHLGKGGLSLIFAWFATRGALGKATTSEEGAAAAPAKRRADPHTPPPPPAGPRAAAASKAAQFATKKDEAVFWSGLGPNGAETAANYAKSANGKTLEQLMAERGIDLPVWDRNNPSSLTAWDDASRMFAQNAKGEVRAVLGNVNPGSVWNRVEFPALKNNPAVTKIIGVDPVSGAQKVLWP